MGNIQINLGVTDHYKVLNTFNLFTKFPLSPLACFQGLAKSP